MIIKKAKRDMQYIQENVPHTIYDKSIAMVILTAFNLEDNFKILLYKVYCSTIRMRGSESDHSQ